MSYTEWFIKNKLEQEHSWFQQHLLFETILGSRAYGCETETSDYDIFCVVMPRRDHLWPQNFGYILGYDELPMFRRHQLKGADRTTIENKQFEIEWISIIEFFNLAAIKGSPNIIDCLFTKRNLVTYSTKLGWILRDKRKLFLSLRTFYAFRHYAYSQMHKIRNDRENRKEIKNFEETQNLDKSYDIEEIKDEMKRRNII